MRWKLTVKIALLTGVLSSHLLSVTHDLIPDLVKVVKLLSGEMQELSPFIRVVLVQRCFRNSILEALPLGISVRFGSGGSVDQLQDLGISDSLRDKPSELTRGRRVTIPVPRGRKSRPTMF